MFRSFVFHRVYYSICLILALLVTSTAVSQTNMSLIQPSLVKDINTATLSSSPLSITPYKDGFFFTANDHDHGRELWVSDGTEAGTRMVKDVIPKSDEGQPYGLTMVGERLFFGIELSEPYRHELWVSDGTFGGTYLIGQFTDPRLTIRISNLTDFNGVLFFTAPDSQGNLSLWRSDGTPGSVTLVSVLTSRRGWTEMIHIQDRLYFIAPVENGTNLWISDGTSEGTMLLRYFEAVSFTTTQGDNPAINAPTIPPRTEYFSPRELTNVNGTLFFRGVDSEHGHELWTSDGTPEGTRMVVDATPGVISNFPKELTMMGDTLFYVGINYATERGIWRSDGTPEGTQEVRSFPRPEVPPTDLVIVNDTLFFAASDEQTDINKELWRSDGTTDGTHKVKELVPGSLGSHPQEMTASNGLLFFVTEKRTTPSERRFWQSDGTAEGTRLVKPDITARHLADVNGRLFFAGRLSPYGDEEIWFSDGTIEGTARLKDVNTAPDASWISPFTQVGNNVFFSAENDITGRKLWRTNGTPQGTWLVQNIESDGDDRIANNAEMVEANSFLFFVTQNWLNEAELWRSDGTSEGTISILDAEQARGISYLTAIDEQLYFVSSASATLQTSNGTVGDMTTVKQFERVSHMVNINNMLWLAADDGETGMELWKSDGTAEGTVSVKDIAPGTEGHIGDFANIGDEVFFNANDGETGMELWKSDGTAEGTLLVKDISPGFESSNLTHFTNVGKRIFLIANNKDLWVTDGTTQGTQLVKESVLIYSEGEIYLTAMNDSLFFITFNDNQYGLWVSDGTERGTQLVTHLQYNKFDIHSAWITTIDNTLFFSANNGEGKQVLWCSDGTAEGTRPVHHGLPGQTPSYLYTPEPPFLFNDTLLLSAADEHAGQELWSLPAYAGVAQSIHMPPLLGVPPATEVIIPFHYMNVGRATATDVLLTITVDEALTYVSDTSGITPAIDGERMVWDLPDMGYLDGAAWDLRVQVPEAPYGTRYRITVEVSSAEENHHAVPQQSEMELMVARQTALPMVSR